MKKNFKVLAMVALIGEAFAACSNNDGPQGNDDYRLYNEADSAAFCEVMKAAYGPYLPGLSYAMDFTLEDASTWPNSLVMWQDPSEGNRNKRIARISLTNLFESTGHYPSESWPSDRYGHISPAVWDLDCLRVLSVKSEMFHGAVPECGDGARSLSRFEFDNTNISSLPLDLFTLPNITDVHGWGNKELKHLPDGIENVPFKDNLTCTIKYSGLTDAAPIDIKIRFGLENNEYTSVDWDSFRRADIMDLLHKTGQKFWCVGAA